MTMEAESWIRSKVRALRRHHRDRLFSKALVSVKLSLMTEADRTYWAIRQFNHLKNCSCSMCGNPRRYSGEPTIQEKRTGEATNREAARAARELD